MARKKRKRRLGHITSAENAKAANAIWTVEQLCKHRHGDSRTGCLEAVQSMKDELRYAGFSLSGRGR